MSEQLRLSLTLSGGAALGAYEAGAVTALVLAVQEAQQREPNRLAMNAIGGASAGSLVGMFAAHALLEGIDPYPLLHDAWVDAVSVTTLMRRGSRGPLTFDALREQIPGFLDPRDAAGRPAHRRARRQELPLGFHVALTGLQGLNYRLDGRNSPPLTATSYVDWGQFELQPGGGVAQLVDPPRASVLDFALASAANAAAFAPQMLDRSHDADDYAMRGILNFPDSGTLWYTDGGTIQAQPLGRVLEAARALDAAEPDDVRRVNLLVDPRSEGPWTGSRWSRAEPPPPWTAGLARTLAVLPAQIFYDDLRRVQKVNARLAWAEALVDAVRPWLDEAAAEPLRTLLREIEQERSAGVGGDVRSEQHDAVRRGDGDAGDDAADGADVGELLRAVVRQVGGLERKSPVAVDVISPLLLAEQPSKVPALLAGELLGDFGGFLSRRLRRSDFSLGYASALAWLPDGLRRGGLDDGLVDAVVETVRQRQPEPWREVNRGELAVRDLPWEERRALVSLTVRFVAALLSDLARSFRR